MNRDAQNQSHQKIECNDGQNVVNQIGQVDDLGIKAGNITIFGLLIQIFKTRMADRVVNGVRHPGQRMVVTHLVLGEHPVDVLRCQPTDLWVVGDDFVIVPIGESRVESGQECHERTNGKQDRNRNVNPNRSAGRLVPVRQAWGDSLRIT